MRRAAFLCVAVVAFVDVSLVLAPEGERADARTIPSPEKTTTTESPPDAAQLPAERASYCHGTASVVVPYVLLTTAVDSIVSRGHGSHTGPVFPEVGPGQSGKWGDIIPPFDYDNGQQHFPGLNWPAGSSVLDAGCAVHVTVDPPPGETTTTTSPDATTTVVITTTTSAAATTTTRPTSSTSSPSVGTSTTAPAPAVTTTSAPSTSSTTTTTPDQTTTTGPATGSGSATTVGGVATTTVSVSTTTTSVPPSTGTPPPTAAPTPLDPPPVDALAPGEALPDPLPRILAFVIAPGNNLVRLGLLSSDQVRALFRELAQRRLAHSGSDTGALVPVAVLSLFIGGALLGLSAWPRRRAR